ncbi:LuxR C-terminal-related transcriptional regulator [Nocardia fluminea]|uniref:LuxR C-terminal-related transcriptional regulator n=1 Tax=Nocardia fluminea TaxID=134984 RepID=UPI00371790FF
MTLVATAPVRTTATEPADRCQPQRILVVDENELIQAGLSAVLVQASWVAACYVAGSKEAALKVVRRRQPQLIVISMSLEAHAGPDLCRTIRQSLPHLKVVLMTGEGHIPAALAASLGAVSAFSKHMPRGAIVGALHRVAEGARIFPTGWMTQDVRLSRRELDVLRHVAAGLSNPETAACLNLSRHTVKQHTSAVYRKLGVRNRAEAASRAQELGLLIRQPSPGAQLRVG